MKTRKRWKWVPAAAVLSLAMTACGTAATGTDPAGTENTGTEQAGTGNAGREQPGAENTDTERPGAESAGTAHPEAVPETAPGTEEEQISWYTRKLEESQVPETFLNSLDQFSYRTASALFSGGEVSENENYSPLSLYYALGMAASGAEGETFQELAELLGEEDKDGLTEGCRTLYENLYYTQKLQELYDGMNESGEDGGEKKQPSVSLANSLWADEELEVKEDYRSLLADSFYASSYEVDFTEDEAWRQMESWIADKTKGVMQPELPKDPSTLLALINTFYYYGAWENEFQAEETAEDTFYRMDGSTSRGDFMHVSVSGSGYKEGDGWKAASLGLRGDGRGDEMVFVLPDEGSSVEDLLASPDDLKEALELGDEYRPVNWTVPKFSFGSSIDGNTLLESLGVSRMFTDLAEFPDISDRSLQVSKVIQETHIGLDEQGVEGAAYTVVMMMETAAPLVPEEPVEMRLDRPFIYGIRSGTGGWLFLGVVRDPFAS
ncbi:MAG TPA: serpin family protein [Candidatus Lachnoclostridium stercorigallinarum]|uniref:Serpin family protein n=1 Tax=Candidatus Lachnoclostridium stercorigallinarum TaxID=2838634 RepID=A0A9D2GHJ1_9FIRM|nr:serpin family protein [Candidatus Lachnoclostridium stercorigallinarum]